MTLQPGYGIGLRRQHFSYLLEHGTAGVDWFEIISEDLFGEGGRPWAVAERVRREKPVVLHGTGLAIGNAAPPSRVYLEGLARVIERIEPSWISDHLSWGAAGGVYSHELLPLPYDEETLAHVCERLDAVQEKLGRRLLLENPSTYLSFRRSTITEFEFMNEVMRRTGAGVLLDVNNVYVSSVNVGLDPIAYIDGLNPAGVGQIHLAGHTRYPTFVMDTHVGPVPDEVWALYRRAIARFGEVPTLVEWDTDVPPFETVAAEASRARETAREALAAEASRARDAGARGSRTVAPSSTREGHVLGV